jgi:hypothetical protein
VEFLLALGVALAVTAVLGPAVFWLVWRDGMTLAEAYRWCFVNGWRHLDR